MFPNLKKYANADYLKKLIFDPQYVSFTCWALLLIETILNVFIIERVKYTEIDWIAYMQEVEGFLNGTLDYKELKGDHEMCRLNLLFLNNFLQVTRGH